MRSGIFNLMIFFFFSFSCCYAFFILNQEIKTIKNALTNEIDYSIRMEKTQKTNTESIDNIYEKTIELEEEINKNKEKIEKMTYKGEYLISRYYSPVIGQKKYYNGNYKKDYYVNCQGDCTITANGYQLTKKDEFKIVACPKDIKLGSRLLIIGIGEVECQDRGGSIKGKRLDIWAGIGDRGLNNIFSKNNGGKKEVYLIN